MRRLTRADSVKIDSEEDGWHLLILTEDGDFLDVKLGQDVALDLVEQAKQIAAWWSEGRRLASEHVPGYAELDDAYEITDPKHPGFLETADVLRDRARGK